VVGATNTRLKSLLWMRADHLSACAIPSSTHTSPPLKNNSEYHYVIGTSDVRTTRDRGANSILYPSRTWRAMP